LRCIVDANILIDLSQGEVLPFLFKIPMQVAAPTVVLDEMIRPDQETLLEMGLERSLLTVEQVLEAAQMSAADARLSLGDCAAFIAARDEETALLTGDQRLRKRAEEAGIEVHGVLWVLDAIETAGLTAGPALAASLRKMLNEGARLPADEVEWRLKRWERE
jgi:predicted nucleic acid-binding protein